MNRTVAILLSAAILCGCNSNKTHKVVAPLPAGYDVNALTDCTVPARFSSDDFRWMGGNLTMYVFGEAVYDAADVQLIEPGDTLLYDGEKLVVETVEDKDGVISINGGLENCGAWLQAGDGGTYRAIQFDDHSIYYEIGTAELPLSEEFRIIDCGENPTDPSDTIATGQKLYLETLKDWRREFSPLNTRVRIEKGMITEIVRYWIP